MKMNLSLRALLGVCAFAVLCLANGVHAADGGETTTMADGSEQLNKAAAQATECGKLVNEVNELLEQDKIAAAERKKQEKDRVCKQTYTAEKENLPKPETEETTENEKAATTEATTANTASTANFGGASDAKVAVEMPGLRSEAAEEAAAAASSNSSTDTSAASTTSTEADVASDATIALDEVSTTPEAQKTTITAAEMIASGQIPTSASERAALALQYAREKGMSEEETQALMRLIYRENQGLETALCNDTSSACGIGQYTNGTWNDRCTQFGSRGSFKAQMDCLINDVSNRYDAYTSGKQTCGGVSFDTCNYIQHYAGSYSAKAIANGTVYDALKIINGSASDSAKFFAKAASALGSGDVASILAGMNTAQETGLGATVAQMLGYGSGSTGSTSTQSLVSQLLGLNSSVANTSSSSNSIGTALSSLLDSLFDDEDSDSDTSSSSGSTTTRTLVSTETTVNADGSIKTVQLYSDGLKLTSQTASNSQTTASGLVSQCGGMTTNSTDAFMLMISNCVAALKN
jgi:hypothetical protein